MSKAAKTLDRILRGRGDANVGFLDLCALLSQLGFVERIRGSHHIFTRDGVTEILNFQPKGGKAKAYQVRQVRDIIIAYGLGQESESEQAEQQPDDEAGSTPTEGEDGG